MRLIDEPPLPLEKILEKREEQDEMLLCQEFEEWKEPELRCLAACNCPVLTLSPSVIYIFFTIWARRVTNLKK